MSGEKALINLIARARAAVLQSGAGLPKALDDYSREFEEWFSVFGEDLAPYPKSLLQELGEAHLAVVKCAEALADEVKSEMTAHRARAKHILQYAHSLAGLGIPARTVKKT